MIVSLTVGKIDAGVCVLLTEDLRLIEFPTILLPPDIHPGSSISVTVSRNTPLENSAHASFTALQKTIISSFASSVPSTPVLRLRNATQTSVVLEWDPIDVATADLRSLVLYRNGSKAGAIPKPFETTSTKISGLAVDAPYEFQLALKTSAGSYSSEKLSVRTHKMTDLTGITVTPGIMPSQLRESLETALERMGGRLIESVRIDTTHFVCTEGRGKEWEKAVQMNVPVVVPDWVVGCEQQGRIVSVRGYYLGADPKLRQVGPSGTGLNRTESQASTAAPTPQIPQGEQGPGSSQTSIPERPRLSPGQAGTPTTEITPPTPEQGREAVPSREDRSAQESEANSEDDDGEGRIQQAPTAKSTDMNNESESGSDGNENKQRSEDDLAPKRSGKTLNESGRSDETYEEVSL